MEETTSTLQISVRLSCLVANDEKYEEEPKLTGRKVVNGKLNIKHIFQLQKFIFETNRSDTYALYWTSHTYTLG